MLTSRLQWKQYHMLQAKQASTRSTCSRLQVGAVVVVNQHVMSTGYNGAPRGVPHCKHTVPDSACTLSVHAEANALIFSPYPIGDTFLGEAELYVTHAPCEGCAGLIINKGITRVYWRDMYRSNKGLARLALGGVYCEQVE